MPFLPARDEVLDQLVERVQRDVGGLRLRLRARVLRLGRELVRLVDRPAADPVPSADAIGSSTSSAPRRRRDDDVAGERRDVAVVGEQRAVLAGGHEIDADRVLPRIAARAILDLQLVAVVLLVALHRDGARRRRQLSRRRLRACPCRRSIRDRRRRRAALRRSRADGRGARPFARNFWCAIIRCSSFSSSAPAISRSGRRNPHDARLRPIA